jgi:hypothetical protein
MSGFKLYNNIDVLANASYSIPVADLESSFEEGYRCVGNAGTGDFDLTVTGTPILNMQVFLLWEATTTGAVTILGTIMPGKFNSQKVLITCTYDGIAWQVHFDVDSNSTGVIENTDIAANANIDRTKLASGTNDHIVINDGSGVMSSEATLAASRGGLATDASAFTGVVKASTGTFSAASIVNSDISASADISFSKLAALTSGNILVGNGSNTPTSVTLSGDATLANTGALTIANNAVTTAKIADSQITEAKLDSALQSKVNGSAIFSFDVTIPSSEVLTLGTIPVTLVAAQGANKIIVPVSIVGQLIYNTTPYATEDEIDIYNGGTRHVWSLPSSNGFLFGTVSKVVNGLPLLVTGATDTQYVANQPLTIFMVGGNPTAGDSNIRIIGTYRVITL